VEAERRTNQQNIGHLQDLIRLFRRSDPVHLLICPDMPVDGVVKCQECAGVAQRFGAGRLIGLGEIYDSACVGESVGNDCLTLLAQLEGDDERWSAQLTLVRRAGRSRGGPGGKTLNQSDP
jgi:hypothetical protein